MRVQPHSILAVALALCVSSGCVPPGEADFPLMDAEEKGYHREFPRVRESSAICRDAVDQYYELKKYESLRYTEDAKTSVQQLYETLTSLKFRHKGVSEEIRRVIPPESMGQIHAEFLLVTEAAERIGGVVIPGSLIKRCAKYHALYREFQGHLSGRPQARLNAPSTTAIEYTYKPPLGTLTFGYSDGFTVTVGSPNTPLGTLSAGYASEKGVDKLVVISGGGYKRFFSLDKAFELFIPPARYGFKVRNTGEPNTLVIEIIDDQEG